MRKLLNFKESISKIVYHGTYVDRLYEILRTNEFQLTSNLGTSSDQIGGDYFYYLSVSRIKFGGYMRQFSMSNVVNIVLDGDKFNHRYKGGPVDYWGREFRSVGSSESKLRNDENEERIFSDKDSIPNATSYMKEIHISVSDKIAKDEDEYYELLVDNDSYLLYKKIARMALSEGIPVYFYANPSAFKTLDKRKAKSDIVKPDLLNAIVYAYNNWTIKDLENSSDFPYPLNDFMRSIKYYMEYPDYGFDKDTISKIKNDIHNARSSSDERQNIAKVTNIMRKEKVRNIEDLLIKVVDKIQKRS